MDRKENIHVQELTKLLEESKLSEALDYLEQLPQTERSDWEIENITGVICSYCGQYEEALSFFRRALLFHPDDPEIYYNIADTYFYLEKYEQAELMITQCEYTSSDENLLYAARQLRENIVKIGEEKKSSVNDNEALMVLYYYPPLAGSGVFRSLKFTKYLQEYDWKPTVISTDVPPNGWNFTDDSLVREIPDNLDVIRIPDYISTGREGSISVQKLNALMHLLGSVLKQDSEAMQIFASMLRTQQGVSQLVKFPCGCLSWAYDVIQYIEQHMDIKRYKVMYTTSGPYSSHLIGFYMKKKYGIPWVADYRDPWTDNPYSYFDFSRPWDKLYFLLERILLQSADCNIVVDTDRVGEYIQKFNLTKQQIISITNGYDEEDFKTLDYRKEKTEKFTIGYSGLIYSQHRSVEPVFEAIRQLAEEKKVDINKMSFKIVGCDDEANIQIAKHYGLDSILNQKGYVTHEEALQANLDSDLLLVLISDEERAKPFYTAKIFDYIRSGKPILALAPKDGAVDRLLTNSGLGKALLSTQIAEIKGMILAHYNKWLVQEEREYLYSPLIKIFERKYLTRKLADLFYIIRGGYPDNGNCMSGNFKVLVVCTGGYPNENGICTKGGYTSQRGSFTNMFAHKRVLQYVERGLDVEVFGFIWGNTEYKYQYQGISVTYGGENQLQHMLEQNSYDKILIHFPDVSVFNAIVKANKIQSPIIVWCHGYEVLSWSRTIFNYTEEQIKANEASLKRQDEIKLDFLRQIFKLKNISFVFVSEWLKNRVKKFVGFLPCNYEVIHNYIDCDFFRLPQKSFTDKMKVICIKSHSTKTYANDLTAKAILELSKRDIFTNLEFELYGDGVLFEENFAELLEKDFSNVHIYHQTLSSEEIRDRFEGNHVLLSPTRSDTQGVISCEGMSAGLVVVSSNTAAVPEFMDENCSSLAEFDNYMQLAEEIEYLYYHPEEYQKKSRNAVERVRKQCGFDATIKKELMLIRESNACEFSKKVDSLPNALQWDGSANYWENRYVAGGNSGAGSYNCLAEFKAKILNKFVKEQQVETIIEWGCGDGNQLRLANYPKYIGYDVSKEAIKRCKEIFSGDTSKEFIWSGAEDFKNERKADLALSLDVLYHLVEDDVFDLYMERLFESGNKYVGIYSCNFDKWHAQHVRCRKFTDYVERRYPEWNLIQVIKNEFPYDEKNPNFTSWSDFFFYEKKGK